MPKLFAPIPRLSGHFFAVSLPLVLQSQHLFLSFSSLVLFSYLFLWIILCYFNFLRLNHFKSSYFELYLNIFLLVLFILLFFFFTIIFFFHRLFSFGPMVLLRSLHLVWAIGHSPKPLSSFVDIPRASQKFTQIYLCLM